MNTKHGFGIVEILIGVTIISVSLAAVIISVLNAERARTQYFKDVQASYLLEEGIEALRVMRDNRWTNISTLTPSTRYSLVWDGTTWATSTTPAAYVDGKFDRYFSVSTVNRDANKDIVTSGGTADAGTRRVSVYVSWSNGRSTTTRSISTYLTNIFQE